MNKFRRKIHNNAYPNPFEQIEERIAPGTESIERSESIACLGTLNKLPIECDVDGCSFVSCTVEASKFSDLGRTLCAAREQSVSKALIKHSDYLYLAIFGNGPEPDHNKMTTNARRRTMRANNSRFVKALSQAVLSTFRNSDKINSIAPALAIGVYYFLEFTNTSFKQSLNVSPPLSLLLSHRRFFSRSLPHFHGPSSLSCKLYTHITCVMYTCILFHRKPLVSSVSQRNESSSGEIIAHIEHITSTIFIKILGVVVTSWNGRTKTYAPLVITGDG